MNAQQTNTKAPLAGLVTLIVLMALLLLSPVLYFLIQLLLGNESLFAINGYK